jgi:hypothetical protein
MSKFSDRIALAGLPESVRRHFPPLVPNSAVDRFDELSDPISVGGTDAVDSCLQLQWAASEASTFSGGWPLLQWDASEISTYVGGLLTVDRWPVLEWDAAEASRLFDVMRLDSMDSWSSGTTAQSTSQSRFTASIKNWNESPSLFLTYNHPVATRNYNVIVEHALRHTVPLWCHDAPEGFMASSLIRPTPKSEYLLPGDSYRRLTLGPFASFEGSAIGAAVELLAMDSQYLSWPLLERLIDLGREDPRATVLVRRAIRSVHHHEPPAENCGPSEPGVPRVVILTSSNIQCNAPPKALEGHSHGRKHWLLELPAAA